MRNLSFTLLLALIFCANSLMAQYLSDYIEEFRGDTAVVKPGDNTLYGAIVYDTLATNGRVYLLKKNEVYSLASNPTTSDKIHTVIVGEDSRRLVNNNDPDSHPPVICGSGTNTGGINYGGDVTVKNVNMVPASAANNLGWTFFWGSKAGSTVTLENCLFERTRWVFVASNQVEGTKLYIKDCYFVNMSGQPCRRNGGVYDNVEHNTDVIWVENSTHVMAQGMLYKFRNYPIKELFFNHNTFVNCAGPVFENQGYVSNMIVANNIFVNSNMQPYCPSLDLSETDLDLLPTGLINVRDLPPDYEQVDRKILVTNNNAYWDSYFADMHQVLKERKTNNTDQWFSQMIKMNSRTQAMFDDNQKYPYLVEGNWYSEDPQFTDPQDLFSDEMKAHIREFVLNTVDTTNSTAVLNLWRKVYSEAEFPHVSDWPIPVNLSYKNSTLLKAGLGGFPLGDLNWFPEKKAQWLAQRDAEIAALKDALNKGQLPTDVKSDVVPTNFYVYQNYPNPFNPSTTISFELPQSGNVVVKIYNVMGQEVKTLLNGFRTAGYNVVNFDASDLSSGVYIYNVNFNGQSISKKMVLMK
ncbi:T9SS type A sorting domain-containing protein [Rosettibacter firmus]|uniref:T9SS type A sorting domain-containing protein n=1 Tax=Rosettibacter firmus TaxID=3111522 RepID=UPI00336BF381